MKRKSEVLMWRAWLQYLPLPTVTAWRQRACRVPPVAQGKGGAAARAARHAATEEAAVLSEAEGIAVGWKEPVPPSTSGSLASLEGCAISLRTRTCRQSAISRSLSANCLPVSRPDESMTSQVPRGLRACATPSHENNASPPTAQIMSPGQSPDALAAERAATSTTRA
eukprot:scaffold178405_cov30-Tisochrysis_lutea.AAC.5